MSNQIRIHYPNFVDR